MIQNPFTDTISTASNYSANTFGNSVYFDGTGDYLSSSGAAVANFGTGDFTFETWFNVSIAMNSSEWDIFEAAPTAGAFQLYKTATNN